MIARAVVIDALRHAWRRKLPLVLGAILLMLIAVLPRVIKGDGTSEGEIRLFMLYAGHLSVFILTPLALGYSIWFEHQEREMGVTTMVLTRPTPLWQILMWRISAHTFLLTAFAIASLALAAIITWQWSLRQDLSPSTRTEILSRLMEVRERQPLHPVNPAETETKIIQREERQSLALKAQQRYHFTLPIDDHHIRSEISGKIYHLGTSAMELRLQFTILENGRGIWRQDILSKTGETFHLKLPDALPKSRNLEVILVQDNPAHTELYLPSDHPLSITRPSGSFGHNLFRSGILLTSLYLYIIALSTLFAHFLSAQGSLLICGAVLLVGTFKSSIENTLFPFSPLPPELLKNQGFSLADMFYAMIWKPILWVIPDLQTLNPSSALMGGELIQWSSVANEGLAVLSSVCVILLVLRFALPRMERLKK